MPTQTADPVAQAFDEIIGDDTPEDALSLGQDEPDDGTADEDDEDEADEPESEDEASEDDDEGEVDTADEDEDDSEDEEDEGEPESFTVKVQGEELKVDLGELKSGYQRHQDYTKKTQELSQEREELQEERQDFEQQREKVQTFVRSFESDPVNVMSTLLQRSPDPTLATAQLIRGLAEAGALEEQFARTFVGDNVALNQKADEAQEQKRLQQLEQRLEEREERERSEQERQEVVAQFEQQWSNVVERAGLEFESPDQEQELLREVLQYGVDSQITNLEKAYAAYAWENGLQQQQSSDQSESERANGAQKKQTERKKKRAQAMNPRSASGSRGGKRPKPTSDEEAIRDSLEEIMSKG